jgi:hypothetical protein
MLALLVDIHGNLPALEAVLDDARAAGALGTPRPVGQDRRGPHRARRSGVIPALAGTQRAVASVIS